MQQKFDVWYLPVIPSKWALLLPSGIVLPPAAALAAYKLEDTLTI
jgi:hypothetical protein